MGLVAPLGAAGAIGTSVAEALRSEGKPYRVVGRSEELLRRTFGGDPLAEVKVWNVDGGRSGSKLTQIAEKEEISRGSSEEPGWRNWQTQRT